MFLQVRSPGCVAVWAPEAGGYLRDTPALGSALEQRGEAVGRLAAIPGCTCWYTLSVMVALAWPMRSETTFTGTPTASSRVAWVCRRSCGRITGSRSSPSGLRARTTWPAKRRENRSGCRWVPSSSLSTSAESRTRSTVGLSVAGRVSSIVAGSRAPIVATALLLEYGSSLPV